MNINIKSTGKRIRDLQNKYGNGYTDYKTVTTIPLKSESFHSDDYRSLINMVCGKKWNILDTEEMNTRTVISVGNTE